MVLLLFLVLLLNWRKCYFKGIPPSETNILLGLGFRPNMSTKKLREANKIKFKN